MKCGGSCIVAYETIKEWQKENVVDVFTCKETKISNDILFKNNIYRNLNKKNILKSAYELSKIIKNNKYEIILFHTTISWYIYNWSRIFYKDNAKKILIYHGPWHKEAKYKYIGNNKTIKALVLPIAMRMLEKRCAKKNENFIFLSEYMKNELNSIKSIENKKIHIIPGGVNLNNYTRQYTKNEAKKELNIPEDKLTIFTLRRLDKRMGIDDAINAIGMLDEKMKNDIVFIVGGKGGYLEELKKVKEEKKVNVIFAGFIPDDMVNLYFCAADLFLVPSKDLEGFGLVNLESLAMGVPVLARPQGGMIELKDKFDNFYLCDSMDTNSLKEGVEKLYSKCKNLIIEEKNISNYSWENISKEYIRIFKELSKNENV